VNEKTESEPVAESGLKLKEHDGRDRVVDREKPESDRKEEVIVSVEEVQVLFEEKYGLREVKLKPEDSELVV